MTDWKERRRIILIDRPFQYRLIALFLVMTVLLMAFSGWLIYTFFDSEIEAALSSAHVRYHTMREMLLPVFLTLGLVNLLVSATVTIIVVALASHKIAGPVYRFRQALEEMRQRDLTVLTRIRQDDQLQAVSASLTGLAEVLIADWDRLQQELAGLRQAMEDGEAPAIWQARLQTLENLAAAYRRPVRDGSANPDHF